MKRVLRRVISAPLRLVQIVAHYGYGVPWIIYRAATTLDRSRPMWTIRLFLLLLLVLLLNVALNKLLAPPALPF